MHLKRTIDLNDIEDLMTLMNIFDNWSAQEQRNIKRRHNIGTRRRSN
ncbi:MAG: hypothetical protein ACOYK8_10070 [Alphaproteobacteria bacterium]